jgi:uncharacterized membrane-anchored protein
MREAGEADEPKLLDRLTLLHADVVREHTATQFRFSAARAYADLVALRISELREERIEGLQPFAEFTDRRLAPAMRTCEAVAKRLDTVSERVSRATQMLSTRVAISREKQNQELLESMDRRAKLQLRLQETVEGLSIAAITYYIVGLIGYLAKGAQGSGAAAGQRLDRNRHIDPHRDRLRGMGRAPGAQVHHRLAHTHHTRKMSV